MYGNWLKSSRSSQKAKVSYADYAEQAVKIMNQNQDLLNSSLEELLKNLNGGDTYVDL